MAGRGCGERQHDRPAPRGFQFYEGNEPRQRMRVKFPAIATPAALLQGNGKLAVAPGAAADRRVCTRRTTKIAS